MSTLRWCCRGGGPPEFLRYDEHLLAITRHFFEHEKPVASICHGIEILAAADVIRGRQVTTIPRCRLDAEFSGATYVAEPLVIDGNLYCCRFKQRMLRLDEGVCSGAGGLFTVEGTRNSVVESGLSADLGLSHFSQKTPDRLVRRVNQFCQLERMQTTSCPLSGLPGRSISFFSLNTAPEVLYRRAQSCQSRFVRLSGE